MLNAGCNCISERVIAQRPPAPLRAALLTAIGEILAAVPMHCAYYPGAHARHAALVAGRPDVRHFGAPPAGHLPWTLIADVNPNPRGDPCFTTEAFCSLVAETALPAATTAGFLDEAVDFANHCCGVRWVRRSSSIPDRWPSRVSRPLWSGRSLTCVMARSRSTTGSVMPTTLACRPGKARRAARSMTCSRASAWSTTC